MMDHSTPCSLLQAHLPSSSPPKEIELQTRRDQFRVEELRNSHQLEKRQLPKRLKVEHKQRVAEFRKAVRGGRRDTGEKDRLREVCVCEGGADLGDGRGMRDRGLKVEMLGLKAGLAWWGGGRVDCVMECEYLRV